MWRRLIYHRRNETFNVISRTHKDFGHAREVESIFTGLWSMFLGAGMILPFVDFAKLRRRYFGKSQEEVEDMQDEDS